MRGHDRNLVYQKYGQLKRPASVSCAGSKHTGATCNSCAHGGDTLARRPDWSSPLFSHPGEIAPHGKAARITDPVAERWIEQLPLRASIRWMVA
jgi:hypothetical protein